MENNKDKEIANEFWRRQLVAVAIALFLVILMAVAYKRQDLFGANSTNTLVAAQLVVIIAFVGFSVFNWRCPSCNKYLGMDINKRVCRHCRVILR